MKNNKISTKNKIYALREKINHPIYYPIDPTNSLRNLVTVIRDGICAGELTAESAQLKPSSSLLGI